MVDAVDAGRGAGVRLQVLRAPQTDEELWEFVAAVWGVQLPRTPVCPGHSSPFHAFADAYFARHPVSVWKACVPADTVVYTETGPVPVTQVSLGTRVWGWRDGVRLGTVTARWQAGFDRVLTIRTRVGRLRCNARHRVLVRRKFPDVGSTRGKWHGVRWADVFVPAGDIQPGDLLVQPFGHARSTTDVTPTGRRVTEGFAEFCGLLLGDGHVEKQKLLVAHHAETTYMPHYRRVVEREFGKALRHQPSTRSSWLHSTAAAREMAQLGFTGTAHTKRVPAWMWSLPDHLQIAFLRGYLDADGTVRRDGSVEYYSCQRALLEDIRHLALQLGLRVGSVGHSASAGQCVVNGRTVTRGDMHTLRISDFERIGTNDTRYSATIPTRRVPRHAGDGVRYCRVLDVTEGAVMEPVYDLTVEGAETFCADGFITHNSRGFGGKSKTLSLLAITEQVTLASDVGVLGGSGEQSERVIEHMGTAWAQPLAPVYLLASEPGHRKIRLTNGAVSWAQTASQKSVRGGHPPRLRVDEADEVELRVLHAAMGQPMAQKGVAPQTVLSSTHQYPDRAMTWALKEAAAKGWSVHEWCYKESLEPHGWLTNAAVVQKRSELPAEMFAVEIELQEPGAEGRAMQTEAVEAMFTAELGRGEGKDGEYLEFEPPLGGQYVNTADWAKKQDWTVILTWRVDVNPVRLVAFERFHRRPWPYTVGRFNLRMKRYEHATGAHDALGVGDVVADYIEDGGVDNVLLVGRERQDAFTEYCAAVERGELRCPRIEFMYKEHLYCGVDDLFRSGDKYHPPDSIVAGALGYRAFKQSAAHINAANLRDAPRARADYSELL